MSPSTCNVEEENVFRLDGDHELEGNISLAENGRGTVFRCQAFPLIDVEFSTLRFRASPSVLHQLRGRGTPTKPPPLAHLLFFSNH
jgi:hypothetical protein